MRVLLLGETRELCTDILMLLGGSMACSGHACATNREVWALKSRHNNFIWGAVEFTILGLEWSKVFEV
jgi:hypothetical protein